MRPAPVALLLGATLLTGACSQVDDVVGRASERANDVVETARYCVQAIEVARAVAARDVEAAVESGRELVEVAPPELADDARTVLEAAELAQDGDPSALESEETVAAAQRLRTETESTCRGQG